MPKHDGSLHVSTPVGGFTVAPGDVLALGRGPGVDVVLGSDLGMSRRAVQFEHKREAWWIRNLSAHRPVHLVEEGLARPIPAARRQADPLTEAPLLSETALLLVPGRETTVQIELRTAIDPHTAQSIVAAGTSTDATRTLTAKELVAVVALAWPWLQPYPNYRPEPLTYDQAAQLLSNVAGQEISESKVRRRIENLRGRLVHRGYIDLLDGLKDARGPLCEYLVAARLVSHGDAQALDRLLTEAGDKAG